MLAAVAYPLALARACKQCLIGNARDDNGSSRRIHTHICTARVYIDASHGRVSAAGNPIPSARVHLSSRWRERESGAVRAIVTVLSFVCGYMLHGCMYVPGS